MNRAGTGSLPADLARHRAHAQVFQPERLTFAFIAPLQGYPDAPLQVDRGIRTDRHGLIPLRKRQQAQGVSQLALNLKPLRRPAAEVLAELAEYARPEFPIGTVEGAMSDAKEAQP